MTSPSTRHASAPPLRYIVRHLHQPTQDSAPEIVLVGYNTEIDSPRGTALSYAINTARRYGGTIYGDYGENNEAGDPLYTFLRSYSEHSAGDGA